ncbi:MAG: hypothetical protein Q7J85_04980 [Bacillota bacterium]|nr:hypothetical protein [Bacillota bacterium]
MQSFVWGRYDLLINYKVYQGKKEMLRSKEFSRGFSFALNDSILHVEEIEEVVDENLRCETSFSHGVSPISFGLLPLLSKINYLPFKIDVTVNGSIVNVLSEIGVEKKGLFTEEIIFEENIKKESVQRKRPLPDPEIQEERLEEEASNEFFVSPIQFEKEINEAPVPIFRENKKTVSVPFPNQQYYKKHQLFYDYFFNNSSQKKK